MSYVAVSQETVSLELCILEGGSRSIGKSSTREFDRELGIGLTTGLWERKAI